MFIKTNWLDGATATGPSDSVELEGVYRFGLEVDVTGSPTAVDLRLQVSVTGEKWRDVLVTGEPATPVYTQESASHIIRYARLNLVELTGGSSPTVTATVVAERVRSTVAAWNT
jgi:hypothetical protein